MAEKRTSLEALCDKCVWDLHDQSCKEQPSELDRLVMQEMIRRFSDDHTTGICKPAAD